MSWTPPGEFEEYRIVSLLGAGSMGQVFLAHDTLLDRAVAIKFISAVEVGADARARFFTEARAVARLSHPNVVGVHRVGEVRARPYLVSEYVRGTSLAALVKPIPWERALKIGIGLARGLGSAHRSGVLHRDIKPANVMLGDDDEAKLLDFGLAKLVEGSGGPAPPLGPRAPSSARTPSSARAMDATISVADRPSREAPGDAGPELTAAGAIVGTPLYLAPELWRGEPATHSSDVYALGVLLHELIAGRAPHAGLGLEQLAARVGDEDAVSVAACTVDIPARFAELIDACVSRDPARRPSSGDALGELLEAVTPRETAHAGSPYRGLGTFEPEHRAVFFGRDSETRAVIERLRTETFVVVAGDSGAGKSSLCRSAVLPAIAEKSLAGKRWQVVTMAPGPRPRARLEAALAARSESDGLLLFVDQLEELLTLADADEAAEVAARLAELVVSSNTRVLASARSDFLGRLAALPGLGALVGRALFLLGPLSERGLREAIVGPARALGYEFESSATVDELVVSGRRHLPLLQFTLAELWDARDERARRVPADALARIGGVTGALARRADQVMAALGDVEREIAWRVLIRLMTAEGTRAVLSREELAETAGVPAIVARVIERLVASRLLVVSAGSDDRVEVVHEALFAGWPRLVEWRRAHEEGTRLRDLQAEAARRWHERGRPRGLLWRGDALVEYRAWRRRWLDRPTELEAAFARACDDEARRTRWIAGLAIATLMIALSIGIVVLYRSDRRAAHERDVAEARRQDAERQRRTLYVEQGLQELAQGNATRALPYLVSALAEGEDTPALRFAIAEATRPLERVIATNHDLVTGVQAIAVSPDESRFAAVGSGGLGVILDREGARLHTLSAPVGNLYAPSFSPDQRLVIAVGDDRVVYTWDVATGAPGFQLRGHTDTVLDVAFDPQGTWISSISRDGTVRLWDARSGTLRQTIDRAKPTAIGCQAFRRDVRGLLVGLTDGSVRTFDLQTGAEVGRIDALGTQENCALRVTRDGGRLVVSGTGVRLVDLRAGRTIATLLTEPAAIALAPDDSRIATGGSEGVARVWDGVTGKLVHHLVGHTSVIGVLRFDRDAKRLASTALDRTFRVWDLRRDRGGVLEMTFEATVTSPTMGTAMALDAQFAGGGDRLFTAVGNELRLMWLTGDPGVHELDIPDPPSSARLSPDERQVATASLHGQIEVWDLATKTRTSLVALEHPLWDISWSLDGTELLVSGRHGIARIYAASGGPPRRIFVGHADASVNRAAYSPDGAQVVTASSDHTARIWDAASATPRVVLPHPAPVMSAIWSPDGRRVATACWDSALRVWDAQSGTLLVELRDDTLRFLDVTFSPDGTRLAATSHAGLITIWSLADKRRIASFIGHAGPVTAAVWSPDGALLASSSSDNTARVWDVATGRQLAVHAHGAEALQVSWNRAGTQIVVAARRPGVRIWEVGPDRRTRAELIDFLARRVPWKLVDGRLEAVGLR